MVMCTDLELVCSTRNIVGVVILIIHLWDPEWFLPNELMVYVIEEV